MYTKEPRPTDKKILPVEAESIPKEFRVRPHDNRAAQPSLLSAEELAELKRPFAPKPPRRKEVPSPEIASARRPHRLEGGAVQDKLPGF